MYVKSNILAIKQQKLLVAACFAFFSFGFCLILMVATTTRIMQIYKRRQKGEKVFIIKAVLA